MDNMAVCLAFLKGRSRRYDVLVQIRKWCAYQLARGLVPYVRWTPTEWNWAGLPSRFHEPGGPRSWDQCLSRSFHADDRAGRQSLSGFGQVGGAHDCAEQQSDLEQQSKVGGDDGQPRTISLLELVSDHTYRNASQPYLSLYDALFCHVSHVSRGSVIPLYGALFDSGASVTDAGQQRGAAVISLFAALFDYEVSVSPPAAGDNPKVIFLDKVLHEPASAKADRSMRDLAKSSTCSSKSAMPRRNAAPCRRPLRHRPPSRNVYFADVFSGSGRMSQAVRKRGFKAREFDIEHGPSGDVTNPIVIRNLIQDILAGVVVAVMLSPPCTSFT